MILFVSYVRTCVLLAAPFRLPLNLSPLVVINATPVGNRQNMLTPTSRGVNGTPTSRAARGMPVQAPDRVKEFEDTGNGDVASPEAARARAVAVSQDYMEMRTPVAVLPRGRKASIPLQRAVLLASGGCVMWGGALPGWCGTSRWVWYFLLGCEVWHFLLASSGCGTSCLPQVGVPLPACFKWALH